MEKDGVVRRRGQTRLQLENCWIGSMAVTWRWASQGGMAARGREPREGAVPPTPHPSPPAPRHTTCVPTPGRRAGVPLCAVERTANLLHVHMTYGTAQH